MRYATYTMLIILLAVVAGCSGGKNPLFPEGNEVDSGDGDTIVLAVIDMSYNPVSHSGQAVPSRRTDLEVETSTYDIEWTVNFQEYDENFYHFFGDPSEQSYMNFANPLDKLNDGVIFDLEIMFLDDGHQFTELKLYDPRAMIVFDDPPSVPIANPIDMLVINAHDYATNPDPEASSPASFEDLVPFRYLTAVGETPDDYSSREIEETYEAGTEFRIRMNNELESSYPAITWEVWIVADTVEDTETPIRLETMREMDDGFTIFPDIVTVQDGGEYVSKVTVDLEVDLYKRGSGIDEGFTEQDNLTVIADLTALGDPSYNLSLVQDESGDIRWGKNTDITLDFLFPDGYNQILRIPIEVYKGYKSKGDPGTLLYGDIYILPILNDNEQHDNGYYRMSYISRDDDTGFWEVYLMNTLTGESMKLSDSGENNSEFFYNSINKDGNVVAWSQYTDTVKIPHVYIWSESSDPNVVVIDLMDGSMGTVAPRLSTDGNYVVYHETDNNGTTGSTNDDFSVIRIANLESHPYVVGNDLVTVENWEDDPGNHFFPWMPVISEPMEVVCLEEETNLDNACTFDAADAYLVMSPMKGNPSFSGDEISRLGWFLVYENIADDEFVVYWMDSQDMDNNNYTSYSILDGNNILADQQYISRISIAPNPDIDVEWNMGEPVTIYSGAQVPIGFYYVSDDRLEYTYTITFESDQDGSNLAFATDFMVVIERQYTTFHYDDTMYGTDKVEVDEWNAFGYFIPGSTRMIGPSGPVTNELHHWFADTNQNSSGDLLSVLRSGDDRDISTWLYIDAYSNELYIPLGENLDMAEGEHDIPSISQGNFDLTGTSAAYPAVAFDSHHASTGDIYLLRLVDFDSQATPPIAVTFKRLTHNGCSYWPRLSGWIEP